MTHIGFGGMALRSKRNEMKKKPRTAWEWDRTTKYLVLIAIALIAVVVFEVMRFRAPLGP